MYVKKKKRVECSKQVLSLSKSYSMHQKKKVIISDEYFPPSFIILFDGMSKNCGISPIKPKQKNGDEVIINFLYIILYILLLNHKNNEELL